MARLNSPLLHYIIQVTGSNLFLLAGSLLSLSYKAEIGHPWGLSGKESACQCRRHGFNLWPGKIPQAVGQLSPCAKTTEPWSVNYWSRGTPAPQQEKLPLEKPSHCNWRRPRQQWRPNTVQNKSRIRIKARSKILLKKECIFKVYMFICYMSNCEKTTPVKLINIYVSQNYLLPLLLGLPWWLSGKESTCQCRRQKRLGFNPSVRKIPWRRRWQPSPVFLPGESHGQRSLVGYGSWGFTMRRTGLGN